MKGSILSFRGQLWMKGDVSEVGVLPSNIQLLFYKFMFPNLLDSIGPSIPKQKISVCRKM